MPEDAILENGTDQDPKSHDRQEEVVVLPHHPDHQQLKGKKLSWQKLRRFDSLDIESRSVNGHHGHSSQGASWSVILHLAFQSLGIVYGDIGTSPLYVYASTFTNGIKDIDDILGVLSLIIYTITLIPLIKYVFIVLRANDNGDGGTFALYSLLCRYAKVGLTPRSIQISMCSVTYPALLLAYTGQASFLREHKTLVANTFYESIPNPLYWPMFGVAVMASIIASQAMISGTFSIIQQSLSLGCFPRVKIVHTSTKYEGQVYIPEVNYLLMLACVGVTLGFRSTTKIGNAYGIAVIFVMTLTSSFLVLIMIMIWKTPILLIISYVLIIGSVELMYLSSVLYKFDQGGYLPLAIATLLMLIMFVWNDVHRRKYYYELEHKISPEKLKQLAVDKNFCRMPGLAMFYSELVQGIPPIFSHYAANVPALHSVLVFVSIKSLPISKVPLEERFLFRRVEPRELNVFRCVARYGYTDVRNENEPFEGLLIEKLKEFLRDDFWLSQRTMHITNGEKLEKEVSAELEGDDHELVNGNGHNENENENENVKQVLDDDEDQRKQQDDILLETEIEAIDKAWHRGVVHLIGENEVTAAKGAGIAKRILIDYAYNFLKRNLRQSDKVFDIPHKRMLKVGMTYEL
ncbi:potassium transporter 5-like [Rosa rugosa]|uniref:potassium transporter 5-like n=1 Tax=Rosa rugosa TaxID=74645 RepID=UPI002B405C8D|nr:potassium transporter 5-like [Rosa rugosa]